MDRVSSSYPNTLPLRSTLNFRSDGWYSMCLALNPDSGERWSNIVMQGAGFVRVPFTGLLDKNEKEVYKGDMLNIGPYAHALDFATNNKKEAAKYEVRHNGIDFILFRTDIQLVWGRLSRLSELDWNCQIIGSVLTD